MARKILIKDLLPAYFSAALLLALLIIPAGFLPFLKINNAPESYFPPNAPAVVFENQLRKELPEDQVLIALFQGSDIFSDHFLLSLHQVAKQLKKLPAVERVLTLTTVEQIRGTEDGFAVELLINPKNLTEYSVEERKHRVLNDRFAPGLFVSKDGTTIAMVVHPHERLADSPQREMLENSLREAIHEAGINQQLVAVAGPVALDVAQFRSSNHDLMIFVPATFIIGMLLLWWMFRRFLFLVLAGLTIGAVINSTIALMVLFDRPFTLVSSMIPPLLTSLSIALLIHMYNALLHASQLGYQGTERISRALHEIRRPARYTAFTTAAGLSSLGLSPIQPIQAFGLAAAAGVLILYLIIIWLLPPMISAWDRGAYTVKRSGMKWIDLVVKWLSQIGIRHAGWVIVSSMIVIAIGIPHIWEVQAETDVYEFFPDDHPLTQSTLLVEKKLSGAVTLDVIFDGSGRDALKEPERLQAIKAFQQWVESLPEVNRTLSMADIIEEMNWAFHAEDKAYRILPDNRKLIKQYLFIYDGKDIYDLVNRDYQRSRVIVYTNLHGAKALNGLINKISSHLDQTKLPDLKWNIAGTARLFAEQESLMIQGQVQSLLGAVILIFILMAFFWRSLIASFLCMIPNLSPVLFIFILMGIFGIWLDVATAMIASVAVGIAVDDTIHVYHGYSQLVSNGSRPSWALARTYRQAGRAVTATTLVLCIQFLILTGSAFQPTVHFGLMITVGLIAAWIFDLLLLPAILMASTHFKSRTI